MAPLRKNRPDPENGDPVTQELVTLAAGMEDWDAEAPDGAPARTADATREAEAAREARGRRRLAALTRSLAGGVQRGGRLATRVTVLGTRQLTDRLLDAAPRIPVRDLAALRAQHPAAAGPEELADRLVAGARRSSAAVGAGIGAAAVVPTPPAMPVEIAAEVLATAAVEIKLIAELHEVYGRRAAGTSTQRTAAYLSAWANRRGIDSVTLIKPGSILALGAGSQIRHQLGKRLTRSSLRKLPSLTPFLVGAAIGANLNRRDTGRLAEKVREDLRARGPADPAYWSAAVTGTDD